MNAAEASSIASAVIRPSPNCSSSSLGILGRSRKGFFLVGIHAPLTHVMPEHKISDTLLTHVMPEHKISDTLVDIVYECAYNYQNNLSSQTQTPQTKTRELATPTTNTPINKLTPTNRRIRPNTPAPEAQSPASTAARSSGNNNP
ncbi:hypothetical protein EMIT047CA2_30039 [Pseudomonas soli]